MSTGSINTVYRSTMLLLMTMYQHRFSGHLSPHQLVFLKNSGLSGANRTKISPLSFNSIRELSSWEQLVLDNVPLIQLGIKLLCYKRFLWHSNFSVVNFNRSLHVGIPWSLGRFIHMIKTQPRLTHTLCTCAEKDGMSRSKHYCQGRGKAPTGVVPKTYQQGGQWCLTMSLVMIALW